MLNHTPPANITVNIHTLVGLLNTIKKTQSRVTLNFETTSTPKHIIIKAKDGMYIVDGF